MVGVIIRSVVVESVVTWGAMVDGVMVVVGPVLGSDGIRIFWVVNNYSGKMGCGRKYYIDRCLDERWCGRTWYDNNYYITLGSKTPIKHVIL